MHRYMAYLGMSLLFLTQSGAALEDPGFITDDSRQKETSSTAMVCYDFKDQNLKSMPEQKIERIVATIQDPSKVVALGFSSNSMDAACFQKLTGKLNPSQYKNLEILDVSTNPLNEEAVPVFLEWLKVSPHLYINVVLTHLGVRNVETLFDTLVQILSRGVDKDLKGLEDTEQGKTLKTTPDEEGSLLSKGALSFPSVEKRALKIMKRFIFISKGYLSRASKNIQIYKALVDKGKIPPHWLQIHRGFYALPVLKKLKQQRELNLINAARRSMQAAAVLSATFPPRRPEDEISSEEYEREKLPFWATMQLLTGSLSQAALSESYENKRK